MKGTIVVAGSLAQKPFQGGFTWVLLQYLLGFRRLQWDVLFLDRLEPEMCVDASTNLGYLQHVMATFGLADSFAVACNGGAHFVGLSRTETVRRVSEAALFINVMGFFTDVEILAAAQPARVLRHRPGVRPDVVRARIARSVSRIRSIRDRRRERRPFRLRRARVRP